MTPTATAGRLNLELVSWMSEQQVKAGKVDKAEEIPDVVFPSSNEAAEVVHPAKSRFTFQRFRSRRSLRPS
jgi:hypothetical protein